MSLGARNGPLQQQRGAPSQMVGELSNITQLKALANRLDFPTSMLMVSYALFPVTFNSCGASSFPVLH